MSRQTTDSTHFAYRRRDSPGCVGLCGQLNTKMVYTRTVTRLSINRAQLGVTSRTTILGDTTISAIFKLIETFQNRSATSKFFCCYISINVPLCEFDVLTEIHEPFLDSAPILGISIICLIFNLTEIPYFKTTTTA